MTAELIILDKNKISIFITNIIDDKAAQIQYLRLTKEESNNIWICFTKSIEKLYDPYEIPKNITEYIQNYIKL